MMMTRYDPNDDGCRFQANRLRAEPWMLSALAANSSYAGWGPGKGYMPAPPSKVGGGGWDSSVEVATWGECGLREVDDLNVIARFYFFIDRDATPCGACGTRGCDRCDEGDVFTSPRARLGLTLWVLHPRKGASRGVRVREIQQAELGDVYLVLREAARQNAEAFGRIPPP